MSQTSEQPILDAAVPPADLNATTAVLRAQPSATAPMAPITSTVNNPEFEPPRSVWERVVGFIVGGVTAETGDLVLAILQGTVF